MRDIFEILHHNNHDLQMVKYDCQYVLGCKTCGKTLLTETDLKEKTDECIKIFTTLKNENSSIIAYCKDLIKSTLGFNTDITKAIANTAMERLNQLSSREHIEKIDKVYLELDAKDLIRYELSKSCDVRKYVKIIQAAFTDKEIELFCVKTKNELIEYLSYCFSEQSQSQEDKGGYAIFDNDQEVVISCKAFKCSGYNKSTSFFIINEDIAIELEKELPTPDDVYTFKDENDFYDTKPDWDDEETKNKSYREFIYRIENDLYDFSNINHGEAIVLFEAISALEDYDEVNRYVVPARKYLEKHFIEKGDK